MNIKVIVSMDWEGTGLKEKNLLAIEDFKARWNIPIVHFYNPAYYTHPDISESEIHDFVGRAFFKEDEIGLHLHTPQHLLNRAGVKLRPSPCFSRLGDFNPMPFKGQEVMLLAYSKDEVKTLIQYSLGLLKSHGFHSIQSFRAGGWMADERVWESLCETGLSIESSAANTTFLKGSSWEGDNLERYSELLWEKKGASLYPFPLQTFSGSLLEIPNNLGAIDYWNEENIYQTFNELISSHLSREGNVAVSEEVVLVINSHQETAAENMPKLYEFLKYLHGVYGDKVEFITNREVFYRRLENQKENGNIYA